MKKEAVDRRLVLLLVLLVVGGIFLTYNKSTFTGMVVFDEYENQTSCENAGYTWEDLTEENCTDVIVPINETYDCEPCLEYEIINETTNETGDCTSWTSCINETSTTEEECEDIIIGGQCVGDICDTDHLTLCLDETSCTGASGYWYSDACNSEEECTDTCSSLSYECDTQTVCGESIDCGSCDSGYSCNSGTCEAESSSSSSSSDDDDDNAEIPTTTMVTTNTVKETCTPNWECGDWQECAEGTQVRVCTDTNSCGSSDGMPDTSKSCEVIVEETCSDGIQNQDEEGIDCGGSCENKCSFFTMMGSAISGPIDAGKKFIFEDMFGNLTRTIISTSILVFVIGGFVTLFILSKKKVISMKKVSNLFKKFNKKKEDVANNSSQEE